MEEDTIESGTETPKENPTHAVIFMPSGHRGVFPEGISVLEAARSLGVDLDSACGGHGRCGRCQVSLCEGVFPKYGITSSQDHLNPFSETEKAYSEKRSLDEGRRLSCQAIINGPLVVDVPVESQRSGPLVRKEASGKNILLNPPIRLYSVSLPPPSLDVPHSDEHALLSALAEQCGIQKALVEFSVLRDLQRARQKKGSLTCAIHTRWPPEPFIPRVMAVWPGLDHRIYGVAIDLGSTTLAAHLCCLETGKILASSSAMNPQIGYGEDVMSRVSYAMMNPEGGAVLTKIIRAEIDRLLQTLLESQKISPDLLLDIVVVGNPIMHHLLLGLESSPLGEAPFLLATDRSLTLQASLLGWHYHPETRLYVLPCIAGHVGADTAAVILDRVADLEGPLSLIVDVGTNAEIVLYGKGRILACSSPTGPAFEGAQISCGQRAGPGAIERFRLNPGYQPVFKVIGCPFWSDDSRFQEAHPPITGLCGSGLLEVMGELFLAGILLPDGTLNGAFAEKTPRLRAHGRTFEFVLYEGRTSEIVLTQNDVRAVQLAKAALYAGIQLLKEAMGEGEIKHISLAGAFGTHLDPSYAMLLGLIPDCPREAIEAVGNSAGEGARMALLNQEARGRIEALAPKIEKIETALAAAFQEYFVAAMAFPHASHGFPTLATFFSMPSHEEAQPPVKTSRRSSHRRRSQTPGHDRAV